MKLWLISQDKNNGWDTYDSAVVAAETEEEARNIQPNGALEFYKKLYSCWAPGPEFVKVELIGTAVKGTASGVICASFNAG